MLLRETIRKTKVFFNKTLFNFKSFFFGGYQKLPRSLSFNPFSCASSNALTYTRDEFYNEFYDEWQSDLNRIKKNGDYSISGSTKEPEISDAGTGSIVKFEKPSPVKDSHVGSGKAKEKKNKGHSQSAGKREGLCSSGGAQVLAQKMKELEMMDAGDVEQALDIEEALHYYSRLTSPVYLDIVDQFFVDMHSEFSAPQPSVRVKRQKERLDSIRL
ncbi:hypothetical protein L6164_004394 [Bauhinia variegata]|uniref:Uncharacterized protein n=1 Tax=Bauhinia variegata TaxID=167791 RepID=A0ACB9Q5T6_BAUVA|nr:hypothetical protein L6164_004394 [Bauhinia variegata]